MIKEITDKRLRMHIAEHVLLDLPDWFGIEENTKKYIENSGKYPMFAAYDGQTVAGFISLRETSKYTVEIHCMGVLKAYHHKGYGKRLIEAAKSYAIKNYYKFMQVKTVKEGTYDDYDQTVAFYKSVGFLEFEVLETLWDEANPCQIFVLSLS